MDLNVKYIPYVLRKVPALEQEIPLRTYVDDKKGYFFFKRAFDIVGSFHRICVELAVAFAGPDHQAGFEGAGVFSPKKDG